jgi:hypothetical protein
MRVRERIAPSTATKSVVSTMKLSTMKPVVKSTTKPVATKPVVKSTTKSTTKSVSGSGVVKTQVKTTMHTLITNAIINDNKETRVQVFKALNTCPLNRLFSVLKWMKANYHQLVKSQAHAAQFERIRNHIHRLKNRRRLDIVRKDVRKDVKQVQRPKKRTRVRENENSGDDDNDLTEAEKLLLDDIGESEVLFDRSMRGVQISSVVDLCKSGFLTTYCEYIEPMLLNLSTKHGKELRPIGEFIHTLVDKMLEVAWIVDAFGTSSSALFFNSAFLSHEAQQMMLKRVEETWRLYLE